VAFLVFAMFPLNALAVLSFAVVVTLAALMPDAFAAFTAVVITLTIAIALAIIDLRDITFVDWGNRRSLDSISWRIGHSE
jgi:hypothetical protein